VLLYSSMTAALEGGEWSAARPGRTLPPGKTRYTFYMGLGGPQGRSGRAENLVPTGIRSRTVQPVAQSLYRLSYPAHRMRNVTDKNCRETRNSLLVFNSFPPPPHHQKSSRLCNNGGNYGRTGQVTYGIIIRLVRFECWITKATHKHSEYVILLAFSRQQ